MGQFFSRLWERLSGVKEVRLLMLGLDNAGKTSKAPLLTNLLAILYKIKLNQMITTVPTVGFNVETLAIKQVKFNVWDVGGQDKIRPLWRHYFTGSKALVFVVDSQDRERMDEAARELLLIMTDREMRGCPVLIFANKQDLPEAMAREEIVTRLQLERLPAGTWRVQPSCATSGTGLLEGFQWLATAVRNGLPKESASSLPLPSL